MRFLPLFSLILLLVTSCTDSYMPKPRGYFRIDLPERSYRVFDSTFPYTFEYPGYAVIDAELDLLEDLDKLYVDARYPADLGLLPYGKPTVEEAIAFNKLAIYIHNKIKSVLS